jgi:hypothetical protein
MKLIAATLIALTLAFAAAPVQAGQSTKDKIRQLIELDGASAVADAVIDKQRPLVRQSFLAGHPGSSNKLADAYVDAFAAELTARRGEFLDLIVEIYAGTFTAAEVDALLAFYLSPLGQKARAAAPSILVQGQQAGAAWGAKYGADVAAAATAKVKAMGYAIK